jgi:hypothetical protein
MSLLLASLSLLASCASQRVIAVGDCPKPEPLSAEMQRSPPPPGWYQKCLRQILESPQIDSGCLQRLQGWRTTTPE